MLCAPIFATRGTTPELKDNIFNWPVSQVACVDSSDGFCLMGLQTHLPRIQANRVQQGDSVRPLAVTVSVDITLLVSVSWIKCLASLSA